MRLLVIVPDRLTDILIKGEYQPLYYNPGEIADEVHILMTNDDTPDKEAMQRTVGKAKLFLHNYPCDYSLPVARFPAFDPWRLRRWARGGIEIARRIQPDMTRCHGADWNAYLASRVKKELGVPYCISLHINPDVNTVARHADPKSLQEIRHNAFYEYLEHQALLHANYILPVYKPILSYLQRHKIPKNRIKVCYNILNCYNLQKKENYSADKPFHFICVGRLFAEKNPANILKAMVDLPCATLTIVGDGPARKELESLATQLSISDRVVFRPAVHNDDLCKMLAHQDAFVVHTEYYELNKSVLEALLTGLPLIINRRNGLPVPELVDADFVQFVDNTPESYRCAMQQIMENEVAREAMGKRAYSHARKYWDPVVTEAAYVEVYKQMLSEKHVQ